MPSPPTPPTHAIATIDLGIANAQAIVFADGNGWLCGRNLTVMQCDGVATVQFDTLVNPPHLLRECDAFIGEEWTILMLTNTAQPGKTLVLRADWEAR